MMKDVQDAHYPTKDFLEAAFLRAKGIIYIATEWPTPQQAFFVFKNPPDELKSAWQRGDDQVSTRALDQAMNFFRDELRSTRP